MGSFFARARRTPRYLGLILTQLVLHVFSTEVFLHVHRPNSKLLPKSSAKWMLAFYVYSVFTIDGFYVFLVRISATSELLLDHVGFLTLRIEPFFSLHPRWRTVRARLVLGKVDPSNPMTFKGFVPRSQRRISGQIWKNRGWEACIVSAELSPNKQLYTLYIQYNIIC